MKKKYAYLTLYIYNDELKDIEVLIGQKKFMNANDGYIGTNPLQYVFPGGHLNKMESSLDGACREFEEETGFNINFFNPINIKKISENEYADFYFVKIPSNKKSKFKYSKDKIIANNHFYEFENFKWILKDNLKKDLLYKPDLAIMIIKYISFIKTYDLIPDWIKTSKINNCLKYYKIAKNTNVCTDFAKVLKNIIIQKLNNDWFIKFYNDIEKVEY